MMNFVKILHCADIHIGAAESFLGANSQPRRFETLITFEKILAVAEENDVQLILIAGDLFDSNKIEEVFFDRVFAAIEKSKAQVVFCAGNHDPLTPDSPFVKREIPSNLHILPAHDSSICFCSLKTRVYGRSFAECYMKGKAEFSIKPPEDDYINIMCCHGEVRSDLDSVYNSVTKGFILSSGMDYIALGHVHKRTEISLIGNTYCAYSGCAEGQGFDETDEKGVYCGKISKGACDLEFIPTAKRLHLIENIDVSEMANSAEISEFIINQLFEKYSDSFAENLYKINLIGIKSADAELSVDEITERISSRVYFAKVKDLTEPYIDYESLAGEKSLKGIFINKMLERIHAADEADSQRLKLALKLGLEAFQKEVSFNED